MSIQRYARFAGDVMGEIYDGEWVHYSDHAAEAERLRAAVVEEQRLCALKTKSLGEQLAESRADVERLREALSKLESKAFRESLHGTYSGGHHYDGHYEAFHHGMDTVCNVLEAHVRATLGEGEARERLHLSENEEGIWLHVKTAKIEGAVLVAPSDEPRGPIAMATLRAALGEGGGK